MEHEFLFDRDGIGRAIRTFAAATAARFVTLDCFVTLDRDLVKHPKKWLKAGARET